MTSSVGLRAKAGDLLEFPTQSSSLSVDFLRAKKHQKYLRMEWQFYEFESQRQTNNTKLSARFCFLYIHQGLQICQVCLLLCGLGCGTRLGLALPAISVERSSLTHLPSWWTVQDIVDPSFIWLVWLFLGWNHSFVLVPFGALVQFGV